MTSSEANALRSVLVVLEACADPPGDRTPLAEAGTPGLDRMARQGRAGQIDFAAETPWHGFVGVLGLGCHVSLGFASACGKGIDVPDGHLAYRADFVTVDESQLLDPCGGEVRDPEAVTLLEDVARGVSGARFGRLGGPRNLALLPPPGPTDAPDALPEARRTVPPWTTLGRDWRTALPAEGRLRTLHEDAQRVLAEHDVNTVRLDLGENPANALWLHGGGPAVEPPQVMPWAAGGAHLVGSGHALAGLAELMSWPVTLVDEGDDEALAAAVLAALAESPRVVVHSGSVLKGTLLAGADGKRDALSAVDARLVSPVLSALEERGDYSMAVTSDCVVDSAARALRGGGLPFVACGSHVAAKGAAGTGDADRAFTERACAQSGLRLPGGRELGDLLLG